MKRKSLVVAFATYSLNNWDIYVVQITKRSVCRWAWHGYGNQRRGHPRYLNLKQIRSKCVAETRELARDYNARFGGVWRLVYSGLPRGFAHNAGVSEYHLGDVLARGRLALGGLRRAVKWIQTPCTELNHEIPMQLARTERSRWRVEDALTRIQFRRLMPIKQDFSVRKESAARKNLKVRK